MLSLYNGWTTRINVLWNILLKFFRLTLDSNRRGALLFFILTNLLKLIPTLR